MQIVIEFSDDIKDRVLEAFAKTHSYKELIETNRVLDGGTPNPETKEQFLRRKIQEFILESVTAQEVNVAREAAVNKAVNDAKREITFR